MRRREFIMLVGSAVAAWPLTVFGTAQRIAIVLPSFPVEKMNETGRRPVFSRVVQRTPSVGIYRGPESSD
jgi:hypothetical protein